jgi:PmbA protein
MNTLNQQNFRELATWTIDQAKKAGVANCRVNISKRKFVEINYRERKPEVIKEAITQGLYLEVFVDNKFAGKSTPDFRKTTLQSFITDLVDNAKLMEEDPYRTLPDPKYYAGRTTSDLQLADSSADNLTSEERHKIAKTLEDSCLKIGGDKVISVEAGEYDETFEEFVMSSNGFEASNKTTQFWTGASMTVKDEGDRRPAGYHWVGCHYREDLPDFQKTGVIAAQRTLDLMGGKKIQTETLPIIIENRNAARVLWGLIGAMSAGNIQQKRSFLADKKGQIIGSKYLVIQDDPFIPRGLGSRYYDGDGFPSRKRELITNGTLNEFLVDWYYSRKLGWEPTSGAVTNLVVPPGTKSVDTIIKELGRCMVITDFIGGNSNSTTGDFSIGVIGKLYDKGNLVQNVAEMNIADNHLNFWNKLIEVGNDPWLYSQARIPSLVFDKVVVAGI